MFDNITLLFRVFTQFLLIVIEAGGVDSIQFSAGKFGSVTGNAGRKLSFRISINTDTEGERTSFIQIPVFPENLIELVLQTVCRCNDPKMIRSDSA